MVTGSSRAGTRFVPRLTLRDSNSMIVSVQLLFGRWWFLSKTEFWRSRLSFGAAGFIFSSMVTVSSQAGTRFVPRLTLRDSNSMIVSVHFLFGRWWFLSKTEFWGSRLSFGAVRFV